MRAEAKKKNRLALAAYAKPTGKNIKSGEKKRMVPKSKLSKGVRAMNNRVLLLLFLTLHTTRKGSACFLFVLSTELRALCWVRRTLSFIYLFTIDLFPLTPSQPIKNNNTKRNIYCRFSLKGQATVMYGRELCLWYAYFVTARVLYVRDCMQF